MKLVSPNFKDNSKMPVDYTADGVNRCPDFYFSDIPSDAKSVVLVCHDPDATAGVPWVHWLATNITPDTTQLLGGHLPPGAVSGINSFGNYGYGGPSPSPGSGSHRYVFTTYALKEEVAFEGQKSYAEILEILDPKIITKSSWTGIYVRN